MYELKTSSVLVKKIKKKENKQNEIKKLKLKKNIFKKNIHLLWRKKNRNRICSLFFIDFPDIEL